MFNEFDMAHDFGIRMGKAAAYSAVKRAVAPPTSRTPSLPVPTNPVVVNSSPRLANMSHLPTGGKGLGGKFPIKRNEGIVDFNRPEK